MKGPINLIKGYDLKDYSVIRSIYEWKQGNAYLIIDEVIFSQKKGVIVTYYNPPVHQVGNPGLDAYLEGLDEVYKKKDEYSFLIIYGANDPVHAGGDLKESLSRLDRTIELRKEKEKAGASKEEINKLYDWADMRIRKGVTLHHNMRKIAQSMRVVAICGGGTRFGGSAEIPLMADYIIGDSRSGMCFSEAMIGLIPGWSGVARALIKAGLTNAKYMAMTSREVKAHQLKEIGIYNMVVDISFPFPKRQNTGDKEADRTAYSKALEDHDLKTGKILLEKGLFLAICNEDEIPIIAPEKRETIQTEAEIIKEVERRKNPENYLHIIGKPLKEVKDEISKLGRPLAPQSIDALMDLFEGYEPQEFNEQEFVEKEGAADAKLYRDPRFRAGLVATLEQRVADFRLQ